MRKIHAAILSMCLTLAPATVLANEEPQETSPVTVDTSRTGIADRVVTPEGEQEFWSEENLRKLDQKIEDLQNNYGNRPLTRSGEVILNTPRYVQETNYYCVPACAQILIHYVKGILYSQTDLANAMGTTEGVGTYMDVAAGQIDALTHCNYALGNNSYSYFYPNMVADINGNFPVIYSVDPYVFGYGHGSYGHAVLGNGYADGETVWFYDVWPGLNQPYYCPASEMSDALNGNGGYYIF